MLDAEWLDKEASAGMVRLTAVNLTVAATEPHYSLTGLQPVLS